MFAGNQVEGGRESLPIARPSLLVIGEDQVLRVALGVKLSADGYSVDLADSIESVGIVRLARYDRVVRVPSITARDRGLTPQSEAA